MEIDNLTKEQFRDLLKETGMKHHELAKKTGYEPNTISIMASGGRKVSKRVVAWFLENKKKSLQKVLSENEEV